MSSPPVLQADGLTKRYRRRPALTGCTLEVPRGRIVGLVGPNGAGKSTLLELCCGLIDPTAGSLRVLGAAPAADAAHLAKVGFVAQDTPVYSALTVADHLRLGARLNPAWDAGLAHRRIARTGLDPAVRAGRLSGGQRAQLALTLAVAKRPELLILDEPAAALDPLARAGFLRQLLESVAELGASAMLSSHLLGDVERVCDHLIVLSGSRVRIAGDVADLLKTHFRTTAPPPGTTVVGATGESTLVRSAGPAPGLEPVGLEDLVLGYLGDDPAVVR